MCLYICLHVNIIMRTALTLESSCLVSRNSNNSKRYVYHNIHKSSVYAYIVFNEYISADVVDTNCANLVVFFQLNAQMYWLVIELNKQKKRGQKKK